jgi:hypothetical protein
MDNLSVAIGILAPVVVVLIIVAGLRAIIRADRREKEFMAAPDQRDDREDARASVPNVPDTTTNNARLRPRLPKMSAPARTIRSSSAVLLDGRSKVVTTASDGAKWRVWYVDVRACGSEM